MKKRFYLSRQDCQTYLKNLVLDPVIHAAIRASLAVMNEQHTDGFWVDTPPEWEIGA